MSNVPSWKRNKYSDIDYLYSIFQMNIEIGKLVHRTARKYRSSYGDMLIKVGAYALTEGKIIANSYAMLEEEFSRKIEHIIKCKALIETICTTTYIWINILVEHDGISEKQKEKFYRMEYTIGANADRALSSLEKMRWTITRTMTKEDYVKNLE